MRVCMSPARVCVHSSLHCPSADVNGSFVCVPGKSSITGSLWWIAALFGFLVLDWRIQFVNRPSIYNLKGISEDARLHFFGCGSLPSLSLYASRLPDKAFLAARRFLVRNTARPTATTSRRRLNTIYTTWTETMTVLGLPVDVRPATKGPTGKQPDPPPHPHSCISMHTPTPEEGVPLLEDSSVLAERNNWHFLVSFILFRRLLPLLPVSHVLWLPVWFRCYGNAPFRLTFLPTFPEIRAGASKREEASGEFPSKAPLTSLAHNLNGTICLCAAVKNFHFRPDARNTPPPPPRSFAMTQSLLRLFFPSPPSK